MTRLTYRPSAATTATSSQTSGWGCHCQGCGAGVTDVTSMGYLVGEELEGQQGDHVHADRQQDAREEDPPQDLPVVLQMHEVGGDQVELDAHQHQQRRHEDLTPVERAAEVGERLEGGEDAKDDRDDHVLAVG